MELLLFSLIAGRESETSRPETSERVAEAGEN
jgi:hypothetical protein